jgi:hypothetical protein
MRLPASLRDWSFAVLALTFGCTPSIGDACKLHTECSATGGRICEPNLPGGYCTIFNCEPGSCPSEAACVAYGVTPSSKPECGNEQSQRLERTFCMKTCSSQSDCRGGYSCVDPAKEHWEAAILDTDRGATICTVALTPAANSATVAALDAASPQVCSPEPPLPLPEAATPIPETDARPADGAAPRTDAASKPDAGVPPSDSGAPDARGAP